MQDSPYLSRHRSEILLRVRGMQGTAVRSPHHKSGGRGRSRTEKTICLAVSPALKAYGIPGRPRLFEVVQKVREVNALRLQRAPGQKFTGSSCHAEQLLASPQLSVDYITAPPRMALYLDYSTRIYDIYLKHVAPEDIHVYSIDEVFWT